MWEVFTCGKMPYGRMKNSEVVERVQKGSILERPKSCDKEIYDVSITSNKDNCGGFNKNQVDNVFIYITFKLQLLPPICVKYQFL